MGNSIPVDLGNGYIMNIDIVGTIIIICAFALIVLALAVLIVVVLFRQKAILKSIDSKLSKSSFSQDVKPSESYTGPLSYMPPPPAAHACPACGAPAVPGNLYCQKCGSRL